MSVLECLRKALENNNNFITHVAQLDAKPKLIWAALRLFLSHARRQNPIRSD